MKPSELREKAEAELLKISGELEIELFNLRFRKEAGQLKQTANLKKVKHDLARVKTVMIEKRAAK